MIDAMFQAGTDAVLADQLQRPAAPRPPPEPGVWKGFGTAVPRSLAGAGLEMGAFATEVMGAFGQVMGAYPEAMGYNPTGEAKKQAEAARVKVLKAGVDYSNPQGDELRTKARDIMPNPQTTGAAGQLVGGLAGFMGKAVGYGLTLGPAGPLALGGDMALTESDRLKGEGVDFATRAKAGAVAGAIGAASVVVPLSGATALVRAAKGVAIGEGSMAGQSLAEKAILKAAGYDRIADTFDPLDPWAIGMGLVPGALGAKFGGKPVKQVDRVAGTKPLAEMGLGERQALRYDDVRLDAYAVQAAQREGIPPEVLLAVKNAGEKSGPAATSPAGAQGVMQFMPKTFKEFGQGDPMDPMNSIDAGARYLNKLHDAYGNWDAAVAHYNGGGAQAAIVRGGGTPTIPETAKYLSRVKAYLGDTLDQHAAAAVKAEPDLVPAARVAQTAAALDASRLTADSDLAGRDAHVSAVELAADQMGRGDRVEVAQHVQPSIDREANFRDWFGASKATEDFSPWFESSGKGAPRTLYHGTTSDVPEFRMDLAGKRDDGDFGHAIYLADKPETAAKYAGNGEGANVLPVYARAENPLLLRTSEEFSALWKKGGGEDAWFSKTPKEQAEFIQSLGYDSVYDAKYGQWAVFKPEQVKSAIGNSGKFDRNSTSLTDFAAAVDELHAARTLPDPISVDPFGTPASWVIREKGSGNVVMETFDPAKVKALNATRYEAVPILEYLQSLNKSRAAPAIEAAKQVVADLNGRDVATALAGGDHPPEVHNLALGLSEAGADQAKAGQLLADFEHSARMDTTTPLQDLAADAVDRSRKPDKPMAQSALDRAAAEVSMLNPDLLVQLDGMDGPVRVGDLLESVKREASEDVQTGKLVEAAIACALRH